MNKDDDSIKNIAEFLGESLINAKNTNKSLNELFDYYFDNLEEKPEKNYKIEIMRMTISFVSNQGYEITSTHPFIIEKYK